MAKKIVLTTFGSLGDLNPYLALGSELKRRGHQVVVATSLIYEEMVRSRNLQFYAVAPEMPDPEQHPEVIPYFMHPRLGAERLIREFVLPQMRQAYQNLLAASKGADLILSHTLTFHAPLVAEKLSVKWLSVALHPTTLFSQHDPPVLAPAPWLKRIHAVSPWAYSMVFGMIKKLSFSWFKDYRKFSMDLGLQPKTLHPLFEGQFSPYGTLALFPEEIAARQADWPINTICTGFVLNDQGQNEKSVDGLLKFLEQGSPPLVFTRGSAVVYDSQHFFDVSLAAAQKLGMRAVFTTGEKTKITMGRLPDGMLSVPYAPYSLLFSRAKVVVHQCGMGTCAQALHAGVPQLLVPAAFDQLDNASRLSKLGVGVVLATKEYREAPAVLSLQKLLNTPSFGERAKAVQQRLQQVDSLKIACDEIQRVLDV